MDALQLAKMRQDRRKHSVAILQTHAQPRPSAAVPRQTLNTIQSSPPAAPEQVVLNRPQTIRFTNPSFKEARTRRLSSATTAAGPSSSAAASKRADSLVPPNAQSSSDVLRRKSTGASLFQSRSWSIFWDPRFRATSGDDASDAPAARTGDAEAGSSNGASGQQNEEEEKAKSFIARCKTDRLLHVVLAMVVLVGSALIVAGVVWTVTHRRRVMEDKRDFVCGKGIAGGPKCAVRLKGEKNSIGSADWVGGEVVDWWLKNHCVWRGKEQEWWCGSEIGHKEGQGDQVLPDGTWLEKAEEEEQSSPKEE